MKNETKTERVSLVVNAAPIVGLNAAGTSDIEIARVTSADEVEIANGGANVIVGTGKLTWHGAASKKLELHASNNAGADLHTQTGTLSLETTTGAIEIGTTNHSRSVSVGTGGGASQQVVTIGSGADASSLTLEAGTGAINIGTHAADRAVNIATPAAVQTVTIGSTHGASKLTLEGGTAGIDIGVSTVGKTTNIATGGTNAQTINIGTGAAANVVSIGSTTGAASLKLDAGTGDVNIGTFAAARNVNIATGAQPQVVNLATGAAAHTIAIGSTTAGTALTLNAGSTGLISCTARVNVKAAAGLYVTDAGGANGVYINQQAGTTHTLGSIGTTTTLRVLPTLEMDDNITILTDKAFGIGALAKRFSGIVTQTATQKAHDAFSGSEHITTTSAVQTTNNTTTTLYTSPNLLDESATWVEVHVAGHDTGGTNRGMAVRRVLISRDGGGGATVVGSVNDSYSNLPGTWGGGVALNAVNVDTTGNTFRVRVQGAAATINWTCTVRYQTVSQNT